MKKIVVFIVLIGFLSTIGLGSMASTGNAATMLPAVTQYVEVPSGKMKLQDLLDELGKAGTNLVAAPDIADMLVEVEGPSTQKFADVVEFLIKKYGFNTKVSTASNTIVFFTKSYDGMIPVGGANTRVGLHMAQSMPAVNDSSFKSKVVQPMPNFNTEEYKRIYDNKYQTTVSNPISTFSIDVDTASYSNVRRFINKGQLPPADAVRTEELINYFSYDYPQPSGNDPFSVTTEVAACPWQPGNKLVMIGLQGKNIATEDLPPSNLTFLIDVSGSMSPENRLPLLKTAFKMLVKQLRPQDKVSIVVYASKSGLVLEPTSGSDKKKIIDAIDSLTAGGSTAGGEGIQLAYKTARANYMADGNNRVILATDGDFNVGVSSEGELVRLIEGERDSGIYLSVLGFGMGNYKDSKMKTLADSGNGNYAYIDTAQEAKKVLVGQMAGTLHTIAKDVKLQVEFNPQTVESYRLIGYESRLLEKRDFEDDKKDAGDMGAGHSVTAFYEIVPTKAGSNIKAEQLTYQRSEIVPSDELLHLQIRYKQPKNEKSILMTKRLSKQEEFVVSDNFRFGAAIIEYGMLLRNSEFKGNSSYKQAIEMARGAKGSDDSGYRGELIRLMEISQVLAEK